MKPGIHIVSADAYHADPCIEPSLSSSIAKLICNDSPLHAWTAHPRLNPAAINEESERFDIGTIAHALILEGEQVAEILKYPDWRTKEARAARDEARASGKYPILEKNWADIQAMLKAFDQQAAHFKEELFVNGEPEQTLIWQEDNGVWCRARLDWLSHDRKRIVDYKTTGATANPEVVSRTLFDNGYDIQEAFYRRGVNRLFGIDPKFRFIYQETTAPYAVSILACGPDIQMLAEKKVMFAIEVFGDCLKTDTWPGFPVQTCYADLPEWREQSWLQKESRI